MHLTRCRLHSIVLLLALALAVLGCGCAVHVGRIVAAIALHTTQASGLACIAIVGGLAIDVEVARHVLSTEVEQHGRIQGHATQAGFEVQVRTRRATRGTSQANHVAGSYHLILLHQLLRQVTIDGLQAVVVANHDVLAIALCLIFHHAHHAREGSTDGIARIHLDVQTLMLAAPAGTEVRRDNAARRWHAEVAQVNFVMVGQLRGAVGVDVVPVGIQILCRQTGVFAFQKLIVGEGINGSHLLVDRGLTGQQILSRSVLARKSENCRNC